MSALAPTLQAFFTDRLVQQRHASPHTVAAYRDAWRLLLRFAATHIAKAPSQLEISDLDAPLIGRFLAHLEHDRTNTVRTRNARLSAIHALFRYAALEHPEQAAVIARVLAIPPKRSVRRLVTFLSDIEVDALLAAPDRATWTGRRDHTLLALAIQTGLRASELSGLRCVDLHLARGAHVNCLGKDASSGSRRSPSRWRQPCGRGSPSAPAHRTRRCFPRGRGNRSAETPSRSALQHTRPQPRRPVLLFGRKPSLRTRFATLRLCGCCTPGSIPLSSPCGSDTSTSIRPASTSMPTSP